MSRNPPRGGGFNQSTNPAMSRGGHVPGAAAHRHHTHHSGSSTTSLTHRTAVSMLTMLQLTPALS